MSFIDNLFMQFSHYKHVIFEYVIAIIVNKKKKKKKKKNNFYYVYIFNTNNTVQKDFNYNENCLLFCSLLAIYIHSILVIISLDYILFIH